MVYISGGALVEIPSNDGRAVGEVIKFDARIPGTLTLENGLWVRSKMRFPLKIEIVWLSQPLLKGGPIPRLTVKNLTTIKVTGAEVR